MYLLATLNHHCRSFRLVSRQTLKVIPDPLIYFSLGSGDQGMVTVRVSKLTIVSCEAKKKQAVCDKRTSYLHVAPL